MIIVTGMIVYMSQHWLYAFDLRSEESMTTEQYQFQQWLWIELYLIYSRVISSSIYILWCKLFLPKFVFTSGLFANNGDSDFLQAHMFNLDFVNSLLSPALLGIWLLSSNQNSSTGENVMTFWIAICSICQAATMMIGMTVTRCSEFRSLWYMKVMPTIIHYSVMVAGLVIPLIVVFSCSISMIVHETRQDHGHIKSGIAFLVFITFCQFSNLIIFGFLQKESF